MFLGRVAAAALVAALLLAPAARAATPEASTTDRLQDRREVAAGDRAYVEGFPSCPTPTDCRWRGPTSCPRAGARRCSG